MLRKIALWIGCSMAALGAFAQKNTKPATIEESFEQVFSRAHRNGRFNGVVLLSAGGQVRYQKAFGIESIEKNTPLRTNSIFNLASVSKQFTAACIALLAERQQLRYDDPITRFLPKLPYKNVTIRQLLHHTSGLPDYEEVLEEYWEGDENQDFVTNQDLVDIYAQQRFKLKTTPGQKYAYSNTGYALLASIVEAASGERYEDFLQANVFDPLEIQGCFAFRRPGKLPQPIAQGFRRESDGQLQDYAFNYWDGMLGDGNVFCAAGDLARYAHGLFAGNVVKKSTLKEILRPAKLNNGTLTDYGFGWEIEGETFFSHTGSWEGYNTYLGVDSANDWVFVVLSSGDNEGVWEAIEQAMADFYD